MRYLLMIYPAMAILISIGLDQIASWVASFNLRLTKRFVYITLAALTIMYLLYALVSVYPYYLDYYNALAGGPSNVQENRLFEFGWWGEGVYDSLLYIEHNAPPGATVYIAAHPSINVQYYNIAENFTYAPADGTINVSAPSTYDYIITNYFSEIYLRVINYGEPIPERDLPHLFETFYRVEKSRATATGGTGLGLAIAANIVSLHDGTIAAYNQPDQRTVFEVRLPLDLSAASPNSRA
jgi:hypothetical protein